MSKITLVNEDFKSFNVGDFPYEPLLGAMGEYHYRPNLWYGGRWYDPTPVMGTGGIKMWIISQYGDKKFIEYSTAVKSNMDDMLILATGDPDWTDCEVSCEVRPLLRASYAGMIFRYQDSRCFYSLAFQNGCLKLIMKKHTELVVLASKEFPYCSDNFYSFKVVCDKNSIKCYVNNELQFDIEDNNYSCGRVAISSMAPAQFTNFKVTMEDSCYQSIVEKRSDYSVALAKEKAKYPQPLLCKVIDFKDFGAGRNVRFGHLTGNDDWYVVVAQNQKKVHRDAHAHISCLTAVDLDGNILWQIGEPNPEHAFVTADLPFQVYDIDGDGKDEVIVSMDFKVMILDGSTGKIKKWMHTPEMSTKDYPFDRLNVDSIRICNFSGKERPSDILIKDRYKKLWAYDENFNFLWTYDATVSTGHFAYTKDINGDGREEMFVGYDLVDADGKKIWSLPVHSDHTDEIIIGKIDPDRGDLIGIVSGSEGFMLADLEGNIVVRDLIGHAQRISTGNYRPELPGLEVCVTTFWGNQGIIRLYDCKGNLLWTKEPSTNGNVITPVNWSGKGEDLILLNGNIALGGLVDGHFRQVVRFPEDGHPELCAEAMDLTGDCREEIILWDEKRMYIYTQDNEFKGDKIYAPHKYPHYNASNYRGEYSYPKFEDYIK